MTSPPSLAPLIVTPWYGGTHGGVAVATESLAHAMLDAGVDCAVLRLAPDGFAAHVSAGTSGEEIVDLCVRSDSLAEGTLSQRAGYHARRRIADRTMRRLVVDHHLRIAHFHFVAVEFDIMMRLARANGLGIVTTFHGADVNDRLTDPAMRPVVEDIVQLSDRITVVSRTLHDRLLDAIPDVAPRLSLVPNVVPTSFARAIDARPAKAHAEAQMPPRWDVLLVGQLILRKGGDVLLDALPQILRAVPAARIALAGTGELEQSLRDQAARLGVEAHVDFLGEISRNALQEAYRRTRILAIPSRSEGLPLVLLESQWMGIPAIASAVDGLPEAITDGVNGLLVPPDDAGALATAIITLLSDDALRARLGEGARHRARDRYAPDVMVRTLQRVYAEAYRDRHVLPELA